MPEQADTLINPDSYRICGITRDGLIIFKPSRGMKFVTGETLDEHIIDHLKPGEMEAIYNSIAANSSYDPDFDD